MKRITKSNLIFWCGFLLLFSIGSPLARGQAVAGAQISGVVIDPSGAVVPGAKVTATQADTGISRTTVTTSTGTYSLPNLPVGPYSLQVEARGFIAYRQTGIVLQVGNAVTINVKLELGKTTQQVQVSANASMVETQSTAISQVIDQRRIVDLPLNGRQATELILLSGGAQVTSHGDLASSNKVYQSSTTVSIAGGQGNATTYLMDGGLNMDNLGNVNLPFPFPDAIREFSVQTSGLAARYGVHPGGVVNVVTKSGSNQFHGDLFEFVRNGDFNARNFFAATQDTLKRNQFGGTIGGPIKRNKLFGFFGYQGTRLRTAPPQTISFVPTTAMLNGDFSQVESAACQSNHVARTITNPATGQPFAKDFVSPTLFNSQALNLLKSGVPSTNNPCGEITYGIPTPSNENQYIGRIDWNVSPKQTFFGRYFVASYNAPAPASSSNVLLSVQAGESELSQSVVLGDTYTLSPTTVNSAHATWTRMPNRSTTSPQPTPASIGLNIFSGVPNMISVGIDNHFSVGATPALFVVNTVQLADDVDSIHGRNHFSFGGMWIHNQLNENNAFKINGAYSFNGQFTNDPLLDFLLGLPSDFTQGNGEYENWRQNYFGTYFQDDVHVSSKLQFHVGLRWEPFLPEVDKFGRGSHFDPVAFAAGTKTTQYVNAPPGLLFVGDPGIPPGYVNHHLAQFEPRVGFAWDPTGTGKQTLRASYSIFYDTPEIFYNDRFSDAAPWGSSIDIPSPVGGFTNPYQGYPGGNPFPLPFPPTRDAYFPPEGIYVNLPLNLQPTNVQQWNLSYQRQMRNNWLVSISYLGNKTTHAFVRTEQDPAIYIPGTCNGAPCSTTGNTNQRRVLYLENPSAGSFYSSIGLAYPWANAEYNALLLRVQHRFARNYTILGNYTYSHCISEARLFHEVKTPDIQDPFNPLADRGNCDWDIRQIFNLSFVAEAPHFRGTWNNRLFSGWQLAPIISVHSGPWYSPRTHRDNSLSGVGNDRPNVVSNPYVENTSTRQWLSPTAFVPNALGTFGNAGANSLVGPGYFDIDTEVSRFFNITERQRLELRFEFFNLGNNVNFGGPTTNLKSSTFGEILSAGDPRILQFALKYYF